MELPEEIKNQILLQNSIPHDEFLGLSPTEMHYLLYDTFGDRSPVQLLDNMTDETLDQIPLFRIVEEYLKIIQRDKQIKLTPLGALPKKVVVELYEKRFLLDEHIENGITKLWREQDCISIQSARLAIGTTNLVKKVNGKLSLTKAGTKLMESNDRTQLFKQFFQAFIEKFNWGFNDGYPDEPIGQLGWGFSVFILHKYGDQFQPLSFYAQKYLNVFPMFVSLFQPGYSSSQDQFSTCYGVRTFDRFLLWFGLVTLQYPEKRTWLDSYQLKRTDLMYSVFKIDA